MAKKRKLEQEEEAERDTKKNTSKKMDEQAQAGQELDKEIKAEVIQEVEEEDDNDDDDGGNDVEGKAVKGEESVPIVSSGGIRSGVFDSDVEVKLYEPGYRERYYVAKFNIKESEIEALRKDLVRRYVEGVSWVLAYYYQGCASWDWYYPYHYAPFASDFFGIADMKIEFEEGEPILPYEQLMSVLPAASAHTLPSIFKPLMSEPDSEIIDFYPTEFPIDMNGKKMSWQGIALLPFIEAKRLLRVVRNQYSRLTEYERSRNVQGTRLVNQQQER